MVNFILYSMVAIATPVTMEEPASSTAQAWKQAATVRLVTKGKSVKTVSDFQTPEKYIAEISTCLFIMAFFTASSASLGYS